MLLLGAHLSASGLHLGQHPSLSSPTTPVTRDYVVRTEQGTSLPLPTAGTQGPQLPFLTHLSQPAPGTWPRCPLPLELGAERAGRLLPPPCLKLGREALRTGPHQGLVAFFLTLKRSAIICHYGPRLPPSHPYVRVGGRPGNTACEGCSLMSSLKVTEETTAAVCVRICRWRRWGTKPAVPVKAPTGWTF